MKLNQVTLPALDVRASVAFYRALGFRQIVDAPHYARFDSGEGGASFSVHAVDAGAAAAPVPNPTVVYFEFDSAEALDTACERLRAAGIEFTQAPRDERWLWREARLLDPAGNVLCLYHAGKNRLDPPWRMLPVF